MNTKSLVDVVVTTYNHENYIAKAIEGILMQKTTFPFRIMIGEDCSTDNTASIIAGYAAKYPDIIVACYNIENIGMQENGVKTFSNCTAKYIAICDGDDYWTDIDKLQKQVSFLEANKEFSCCFTDVEFLANGTLQPSLNIHKREVYAIEDIISQRYSYNTSTLLFRNILLFPLPITSICGDYVIVLMLALQGNIGFIPQISAVYRVHGKSAIHSMHPVQLYHAQLNLLGDFNDYTELKYEHLIRKRIQPISKEMLMYGSGLIKGGKRFLHIMRSLKAYIKYSDSINFKELGYYLLVLFMPVVLKKQPR